MYCCVEMSKPIDFKKILDRLSPESKILSGIALLKFLDQIQRIEKIKMGISPSNFILLEDFNSLRLFTAPFLQFVSNNRNGKYDVRDFLSQCLPK